jgi:hypothetical protein
MNTNPQDGSRRPVVLTYRPAEKKLRDARSPVRELERGKEETPWLTSHQRTEASDDNPTRAHTVSRARHVQADGAAALPLASTSRSDGTLSILFGEPQRRFECRLREGKIEGRST